MMHFFYSSTKKRSFVISVFNFLFVYFFNCFEKKVGKRSKEKKRSSKNDYRVDDNRQQRINRSSIGHKNHAMLFMLLLPGVFILVNGLIFTLRVNFLFVGFYKCSWESCHIRSCSFVQTYSYPGQQVNFHILGEFSVCGLI